MRFLKNTLNFSRTCALAQKTQILRVKNVKKKQILTHSKAAKLATLGMLFQLEIVAGKKEYLYESQFAWRCLNLKL